MAYNRGKNRKIKLLRVRFFYKIIYFWRKRLWELLRISFLYPCSYLSTAQREITSSYFMDFYFKRKYFAIFFQAYHCRICMNIPTIQVQNFYSIRNILTYKLYPILVFWKIRETPNVKLRILKYSLKHLFSYLKWIGIFLIYSITRTNKDKSCRMILKRSFYENFMSFMEWLKSPNNTS